MQDYISEPTHHVKAKTHSLPYSEPHSFPNKGENIKQKPRPTEVVITTAEQHR